MDDDFRTQLERRLATLRGHRVLLEEQLRDFHQELNSVARRIEAAEELYRREYDAEPPNSTAPVHARRATRIRRADAGQPSWKDAVIGVLREADHPLHAREIWQRLQESGFQTGARDPLRSVVAIAIRAPEEIHRTGPNTFALNGADANGAGEGEETS
jgi:HB1/ASXL restriction endonuclease-like protein with HTH domain